MAQVQAELAAARAENETLRTVTQVLLEEMDAAQFARARARLDQMESAGRADGGQPVA